MTKPPNLGPILAGAGLAIIVAAVVTGFIAVGGPGSARADRLDAQKFGQMRAIANATVCRIASGDEAPGSLADLAAASPALPPQPDKTPCINYDASRLDQPGVDYERVDATHIRLCAEFLRPFDPERQRSNAWYGPNTFSELNKPGPAGRRCYDLTVG